ncbi:apoptosis regulatory protein Siva-like [Eriocheir sinensis]|uniref:apoptosis regulatory protein Siva-like n=1 Tax=Eriocheir sinensis TaxID=95602 RepID=UPI0021C5AAD5|nr:apoptosis regulatory protein Siva-like [Eriocheir sinensis]
MPKRPCPFEDDLSPRAKVQAGPWGARLGGKRREVYDRTLTLLFSGAKNVTNNNTPEVMDASPTATATAASPTSLQQLLLTPHGTLAKPPQDMQALPALRSQPATLSACVGCRRVSPDLLACCHYCECRLCEDCQRACHFCGGSFCPKCSLAVYLQEERVVCLSCC